MPAMFVAPLAIAQPANFVTVPNQPMLNLALRPTEQQSVDPADLAKLLRALADRAAEQAPQQSTSCNKTQNSPSPVQKAPPVPPADRDLEDKVNDLEGKMQGLSDRMAETNANLQKVLDALKSK